MCAIRMVPLEKHILNTKERKFMQPTDPYLAPGQLIELGKWFPLQELKKCRLTKGEGQEEIEPMLTCSVTRKGCHFCDLSLEDGASLLFSQRTACASCVSLGVLQRPLQRRWRPGKSQSKEKSISQIHSILLTNICDSVLCNSCHSGTWVGGTEVI